MMSQASLLDNEERTLETARAMLHDDALGSGTAAFADLTRQYARLLRHTRYLIRVSDRMQEELNRLNENLRESEEKYRSLFENASEGIFIARLDGQFLQVNPVMAKIFGCPTPDDFLNIQQSNPVWPFLHNDKQELFDTLGMNGQASRVHMQMQCSDGQTLWVEINARVRPSDPSHPDAKIEGILSDITERKRMVEELRHLATTDSLTGLYNRRSFLDLCDRELQRTRRHHHEIALLMLDADQFKDINDSYGHDVGDHVLQIISRLCLTQVREVDVVGRLGGEEFAILLPQTGFAAALDIAERIRSAIAQAQVPTADGQVLRFTVSIGGYASSGHNLEVDELIRAADQALYTAKRGGRNLVRMYEPH